VAKLQEELQHKVVEEVPPAMQQQVDQLEQSEEDRIEDRLQDQQATGPEQEEDLLVNKNETPTKDKGRGKRKASDGEEECELFCSHFYILKKPSKIDLQEKAKLVTPVFVIF
jgi:hypothetical protein